MSKDTHCLGLTIKNRRRALDFYSAILGRNLREHGATPPTFEEQQDSAGVLLRLRIDRALDAALEIVWSSGGQVLEPEARDRDTPCAVVLDTEGNRVALYTQRT